jgi:hypothetical protein
MDADEWLGSSRYLFVVARRRWRTRYECDAQIRAMANSFAACHTLFCFLFFGVLPV